MDSMYSLSGTYLKIIPFKQIFQKKIRTEDTEDGGNGYGCNLYSFEFRDQKEVFPQNFTLKFEFDSDFAKKGCFGYAFILSTKLQSISSIGQKRFDLLWVKIENVLKLIFQKHS